MHFPTISFRDSRVSDRDLNAAGLVDVPTERKNVGQPAKPSKAGNLAAK